jgi:hypothetical protein
MSLDLWLGNERPKYIALLNRGREIAELQETTVSADDRDKLDDELSAVRRAMGEMRRVGITRGIVLEQFGRWGYDTAEVSEDGGQMMIRFAVSGRRLMAWFDLPAEKDDITALQAGARAAMEDARDALTREDTRNA